MSDWDEHVANREEAEAEERWLNAERREWACGVIGRLETRLGEINQLRARATIALHSSGNRWDVRISEFIGESAGIRTAITFLREEL